MILPSSKSDFVIYSDAFKNRLGCVLMQGWMIGYASEQLKLYKQLSYLWFGTSYGSFGIKTLEALVVRWALLVFMDHKSLKCLFTQKKLMWQWRWLQLIKDYDLIISYHSDKANKIADTLSGKIMATMISTLRKKFDELNLEIVDTIRGSCLHW